MAREWDEVMLWTLAEKLSERIDAIRARPELSADERQIPRKVERNGNVIDATARFVLRR